MPCKLWGKHLSYWLKGESSTCKTSSATIIQESESLGDNISALKPFSCLFYLCNIDSKGGTKGSLQSFSIELIPACATRERHCQQSKQLLIRKRIIREDGPESCIIYIANHLVPSWHLQELNKWQAKL